MSLTVTENLQESDVQARPQDFILHSFNALNPIIAQDPNNVFSQTSNFVKAPLTDNQVITQTFLEHFSSTKKEYQSSQESNSEFAASIGIKGSYGFFSGSLKSSYEKDTYQKSTSYSFSFNCFIDCGTVTFYQSGEYSKIRACLQDELINRLDSITTLKQAGDFTNTYGTHLIGGLKLGGFIQLKSQAETTDYTSKEAISVEVELAYNGVADISSAASVAQKLSTASHSSSFTESASTSGGSSSLAVAVDPKDKNTIIEWAKSCTKDTAYALTHTIEISKLAANPTAQAVLQKYLDLVVLAQSISNPTIISAHRKLTPFALSTVDAVASDPHFRIIGGGAMVPMNTINFLVNSFPQQDSQTQGITGWTASSHDIAEPSDRDHHITSYAIAIYDPTYSPGVPSSLLDVQVGTGFGTNKGIGRDSAAAKVPNGFLLSGGGIESETPNKFQKFVLGSYPSAVDEWTAKNSDYENAASEVTLTAYAIGIKSLHPALTITASRVATPKSEYEYGNQVAQLGEGVSIASGGVSVENKDGFGNLVQQSYPSSASAWTEYDKDTDGHVTYANCAAYAIGFTPHLNI
ncbi:MACPF domain-containing protein [Dyadobacter sp. CY261]|uniref:MAC/perforin domain-containing protein n=1 Tax=Dyadobacter sp. CY261 TaxID=2907203 RepID=UPI001F47D746|nr:MAC/perforin domain-containing protein [Dyadobacter sp. CY261]MCF0069478.1 MACPF domain-containing protein [Dyadobacter sp. CY261]